MDDNGIARSSDDKLTLLLVREYPVGCVLEKHVEEGLVKFVGSYLTSEMEKGIRKL